MEAQTTPHKERSVYDRKDKGLDEELAAAMKLFVEDGTIVELFLRLRGLGRRRGALCVFHCQHEDVFSRISKKGFDWLYKENEVDWRDFSRVDFMQVIASLDLGAGSVRWPFPIWSPSGSDQ
jgi:hypothetical protein